jgi:MoxR-like ATPase
VMTTYRPLFVPRAPSGGEASPAAALVDRSPPSVYVFTDEITVAVNVALATGRPLLVRGPSGAGKTSLARSVADQFDANFREAVVTARTQARDLLWTADLLRRLQDAQTGRLSEDWRTYIVPGPFWWAFDSKGAQEQHALAHSNGSPPSKSDAAWRTVLLIDEIDKADPDVPNSLLRPIGDLAFDVEETGQRVEAHQPTPLIVITTNEERDLPPAFLRRCVELNMPAFNRSRLMDIGRAHYPGIDEPMIAAAAELVLGAGLARERREPNPAEYLDVLRACQQLGITPASTAFKQLAAVALGIAGGGG